MSEETGKKTIKNGGPKNVLLAVVPFWDPLLPPQGISGLKKYLSDFGYKVKTVDFNVQEGFLKVYDEYFDTLKRYVPESNWGNLHNIGHFVLQNHLMAHFNYGEDEADKYRELVEILVYNTFFTTFTPPQIEELIELVDVFYRRMDDFLAGLMGGQDVDVFGVTINTGTFPGGMYSLKYVKEHYPSVMTVAGGNIFADQLAVGSPNYEYFLEKTETYLDHLILGQGEMLLHQLLEGNLPSDQRVFSRKDIGGKILGFDELKLPDLSDYEVLAYPYLAAGGSASCKFQCSFCNSVAYWGDYRQKDPKQVVREMETLYKEYGNQLFFMTDSMLNPYIDELAAGISELEVPLYYDAYFRVDEHGANIDKTLKWREGGFYRARMGVETGSQHILDLIGKEITVEQTKAALAGMAYAGIKTTTYWVIGHPGETEEDFQQTLDLLEEMSSDIYQAECAQFDYYYDGQAQSDFYAPYRKLLYPEWAKHMLVSESYIVGMDPTREVTYQRIFRFVEHCKKLGIPNPYSLQEIQQADQRWQRLHKNAVPPMLDFKRRDTLVIEKKKPAKYLETEATAQDQGDFGF
jgi:radical SAM superfamily enzyme YgiQ (UPF0313 family)